MINTCKLRDALYDAHEGGPGAYPQCSPAFSTVMAFMALVQALVRRKTEQSPRPSVSLDQQSYDFIVVGAGAAGAVVAARLAEAEFNVLLLEAGGEEPQETEQPGILNYFINSSLDWQYRTQPVPQNCGGRGCDYPSGKGLGGGTAMNSMVHKRGNPRDFDAWRDAGNEGWGWNDVLPYFRRYEDNRDLLISYDKRHHATGGPQSVERFPTTDINAKIMADAYEELGYPLLLEGGSGEYEHRKGVFALQFTSRDGVRQSTNRAYLEPLRRNRKLHVVTRARVTKVILDKDLTARGVQFMDDASNGTGRPLTVFATKEVILSAGAIKSPKILQLSGIGPRAVLERAGIDQVLELPVGLNLQDHVNGEVFDLVLTKTSSVPDGPDGWVRAQREYNRKQNGPMATVNVMAAYVLVATNYTTDDYPDIGVTLRPVINSPPCASTLEDAARCANKRRNLDCQVISYPFYNGITIGSSLLRPRSRGNVTVANADPFAEPNIYFNGLSDPHDVEVLVQAARLSFKLADTRVLRDNGYLVNSAPIPPCDKHPYTSEERIRCALREFTRPKYHACCTNKMAADGDPTAVVDQRLRVRGVRHLRVVDASIMPTITSTYIVAPTIMIGEKGAAMIIEDWKNRRSAD